MASDDEDDNTANTSNDGSSSSNNNTSSSRTKSTICRVQMWLDSRSDLATILQNLSDPAIQFLDLYVRESFMSGFSRHEIEQVMRTIGTLPKLERLDISCPYMSTTPPGNAAVAAAPPPNPQTYLPVSAIQLAFTKDLTHLLLVNVKICGSQSEFEAFAKATQRLPQLHCVVLAEVHLLKTTTQTQQTHHPPQIDFDSSSSSSSSYSVMDPLLQSLTKVSSLHHVLISGSEDLGTLQESTLRLCMKQFRDLCLSQLALTTTHLQALTLHNKSLINLRELDLQCHFTVEGARALAHLLQNNDTVLEELTLRLIQCPQTYSATPRTAAAQAVLTLQELQQQRQQQQNQQQQEEEEADNNNNDDDDMDMASSSEDDDDDDDEEEEEDLDTKKKDKNKNKKQKKPPTKEDLEYQRNVILSNGIIQSRRLTSFELESANLSTPKLLQPFERMLHDNYSLESVRLHCIVQKRYCLDEEIAFYTRLNHLGRGHLFQCPHCSQCDESYLNMLDSLKDDDDVSAFYYFCRSKPSLLASGGGLNGSCDARTGASSSSNRRGRRRGRSGGGAVLGKRKRLYRAVKYNGVSYKNC